MASVYLSSATNSTMFTRCCSVAICDHEARCSRCKEFVYPDREDDHAFGIDRSDHQRHMARWEQAYGPHRRDPRRGYGR
jgi:hypothetical protein